MLSRGNRAANRIPLFAAALAAVALASLLTVGSAGAQTIVNTTSVGSPAQTSWLSSFTTTGENGSHSNGRQIRLSLVVQHPVGRSVTGLKIDQNWDGTDNTSTVGTTTSGVDIEQPTVAGGFNYTRVNYSFFTTNDTVGSTTRRADEVLRIRAVLDNGAQSSTSNSTVRFISAGQFTGSQDVPHLYEWNSSGGNFFRSVTKGNSFTFTYKGDDPDTDFFSSDDEFIGMRWRKRNQLTGAVSGTTDDCPDGNDNDNKNTAVSFGNRGTFVVEGLAMNEGCTIEPDGNGRWQPMGSVDVNSNSLPNPTALSATRPVINGDTTITATMPTDPDSGDGGRVQYVEWDVDGNSGNGTGGFDRSTLGSHDTGVPDQLNQPGDPTGVQAQTTFDTQGMSPGLKTVRIRATDNGAMSGADNVRQSSGVVTTTYLVDTPPVAQPQTVTTESDQPKSITVVATDVDNDALTYSITDHPDHGQLCITASGNCQVGTGATRFYRPDGDFAGTDTFTYQVSDGFGGTDTETVTVNVTPQTEITSQPDAQSGQSTANFTFERPVPAGAPHGPTAVTFECRLDSNLDTDFQPCTSPRNYVGLTDGQHKFDVRARAGSFIDPTPDTFTWDVDATLPETFIDSGPANPTNNPLANFTFSSDADPNATYECRLDGGAWEPAPPGGTCATPKSYVVTEGQHTFEVRATDQFDRTDPIPASYSWRVDLTAPAVTIDQAPQDPTNQVTALFGFSSSDTTATFECRLDSTVPTAWAPCTSPQAYGTPTPLGQGEHTFEVRPTDPAGNQGQIQSHVWNIDTTVPDTAITAGPGNGSTAADPTATFSFNSPDDGGAGFECRLDSTAPEAWEECSSSHLYADLGDGEHTFEVRATDAAGNRDLTPDSRTWTVDTTAPQTVIDSGPSAPTTATAASFNFSSPDGTATFECKLDDAATWQTCASPQAYGTPIPLGQGQHTFRVRARDPLGNVDSTPATRSWTVDTTGPVTSITGGPQSNTSSTSAAVSFTANEPATFECRLDSNQPSAYQPCSSPSNHVVGEGVHKLDVRATDLVGNVGAHASRSWTVDTTPPDVSIVTGMDDTDATDAEFIFESQDGTATFQCRLDGGNWQTCGGTGAGVRSYSGLADGEHTFAVRARDPVGNISAAPASDTWTITDSTAPDTVIDSGPADSTFLTSATFTFSASEPSTFQCKLDSGDFTPCGINSMTGTISYPSVALGPHTFTVFAHDGTSPDPTPATWTWQVNPPPTAGGGTAGQAAASPVITPGRRPLKGGRGTAATVSCPTGPCTITGKAKVKIGGRNFNARVKATSPLAAGSAANVTIVLPKAARAALAAAGKGVLKLALTASSSGGKVTKNIKLKVKK